MNIRGCIKNLTLVQGVASLVFILVSITKVYIQKQQIFSNLL